MSTNETDINPDSGEDTDEGGDIQAIGENLFENFENLLAALHSCIQPSAIKTHLKSRNISTLFQNRPKSLDVLLKK